MGDGLETGISVILDVISLIKPFEKLSPVLTGVLGVLTNIVASLDSLTRCWVKGNYFAISLFLLNTVVFVAYMTVLLAMAGSAIGFVMSTLFATEMELMFGKVGESLGRLCA